ncbi:MAG: hypothetical protein GX640_13820 [Fibrobacter sp.]|nr:hypothetical protein [Fibrobacter sp.]
MNKTASQIEAEIKGTKFQGLSLQAQVEFLRSKYKLDETKYNGQLIGYRTERHTISTLIDRITKKEKLAVDSSKYGGNFQNTSDSCLCLDQNDTLACNKYFSQLVERRTLEKILYALLEIKRAIIQLNEAQRRLNQIIQFITENNTNSPQSIEDMMVAEQQTKDTQVRLEQAKSAFKTVWIDPNVILPKSRSFSRQ